MASDSAGQPLVWPARGSRDEANAEIHVDDLVITLKGTPSAMQCAQVK